MAYAINPYSGQQLPARPAGGPVNPAPGPGGGIGGGGQQGGMFGTGGGYMGMPQGPIPSGLAAFKDPRVLMMLSGVASGASQGRNPLSGAIQGGFGAVGSLADMEQQAQRNKMTQREMEFAEQQEERRQRRFESEEERIQRERDREEREREAVRNFLGRFSNGGMGTKQGEGEGTPAAGRTPGGGMRQGLVQLGMEAPGMADYAIEALTTPDPRQEQTTLQRNLEYMTSLPAGDPRRVALENKYLAPASGTDDSGPTLPTLPGQSGEILAIGEYTGESPEETKAKLESRAMKISGKKSPEDMKAALTRLEGATSQYLDMVKSKGFEPNLPWNAADVARYKTQQMELVAAVAAANDMGVLQPGEVEFVMQSLQDPTKWGAMYGAPGTRAGLDEMQKIIKRRRGELGLEDGRVGTKDEFREIYEGFNEEETRRTNDVLDRYGYGIK